MGSGLTGNQKEKTVSTDGFQVKGHLLQWENVAIQISNISLVTSSDVQPTQFPIWGLLIVIAGIALIPFMLPLGIPAGPGCLYIFRLVSGEREEKTTQVPLYPAQLRQILCHPVPIPGILKPGAPNLCQHLCRWRKDGQQLLL